MTEALRRIESYGKQRSSLNDSNEYETKPEDENLVPPPQPQPEATDHAQLASDAVDAAVANANEAGATEVDATQRRLKLIKKTTDENLYQLKTNIKVNKRFDEEGRPKSNLNDVKFEPNESLIENFLSASNEPESNQLAGFFVLFWLAVGVLVVDTLVDYYIRHEGFHSEIIEILLTDLFEIGLTDLFMYLCIYFVYGLHWLCKKNYIDWETTGWILCSVYEFCFVTGFMYLAERENFPWIGKIFLFLHSLVLLMKMHSYGFYNGYLWRIYHELQFSSGFLKKHEENLDDYHIEGLKESINFCKFEISSQSQTLQFPENINIENFFWYTMFPTVVYQIDYPRTSRVRWDFVGSKLAAIFGVILLMIVIAQNSMYPIAMKAIELRSLPVTERIIHYLKLLLDLIPSFILMYLFVFYLIWDAILNCIAELTRFGDRDFYGPWWNCISWDQFARLWNIPVHKFLLRHVYHSSISAFRFKKSTATIFTFLLSSIVHELAMYVLFHKLRGYLLLLQMFQLPLVTISKTKWLKDRKILGNAIFWFGIATGPSLMCTLYLTF